MGHHNKTTTSKNDTHKLGIPEGVVAQRRAELIAAKFSGYAAMPKEAPAVKHSKDTQIESGKLSHLTKSRPAISHRPPSRQPRKLNNAKDYFFTEKTEDKSESIHLLPTNLTSLIKKAISAAESCYREHYQKGTHPRQPNGWFSWWRHGAAGQEKAEEICVTAQDEDTCGSLLDKMHLFFNSPETRFNNHSFASYLLDELDKLLHQLSLSGCKIEGASYDKDTWLAVAVQLEKVVPVEEKSNTLTLS